jgi:peptidoglycan/LPS O-acetylase OafA/YrhL
MNKGFSVYLDLARLLAAVVVLGHHTLLNFGCYVSTACGAGPTLIPYHAGHAAVVLFFILSGYVITYVAHRREVSIREFGISRFARIYSVAIPAILLTICVDILLISIGKTEEVPLYQFAAPWKYLPLFLTFTTDFWFLQEPTFSDGGFWSLCYEVWYYVIFASVYYARGWQRWMMAGFVFILIGPKLWALLFTWVMGSLVYVLHGRTHMNKRLARVVFVLTIVVFAAVLIEDVNYGTVDHAVDQLSQGWIASHMGYAQWFAGDTIVGACFAANVFAAKYAELDFGPLSGAIRTLASFSFTLYLAHGPLLQFWILCVGLSMLPAVLAIFVCTWMLGLVTEHQKDRIRQFLHERLIGQKNEVES